MNSPAYWIGVVSKEHVLKGVDGGFAQLCHGKSSPLKRMKVNDWLIYYSPKNEFTSKVPYQKFTAIGKVIDEGVYPFDMGQGFIPFRRNIDYIPCVEVPILPLIDKLGFIQNKTYWGAPFRYGFLRIDQTDFEIIEELMLPKGKNEWMI